MGRVRRSFSHEFKVEAVRMVTDRGLSIGQVSRDLDLAREVRRRYGSPRMHLELVARVLACSVNRIARLMRAHGMGACQRRKWRPLTTDSSHHLPVAADLVQRVFTMDAPNRVWAADITNIPTG